MGAAFTVAFSQWVLLRTSYFVFHTSNAAASATSYAVRIRLLKMAFSDEPFSIKIF